MRTELKYFATEESITHKGDSNASNKGEKVIRHVENKYQHDRNKFLFCSYNFSYAN